MDLYSYLVGRYGYNEPILLDELKEELESLKSNTLRQSLKRLVDNEKICRFKDGIYFIPNPNSILKTKSLSVNKIINKKYLYKKDQRIGYLTGLAFANLLQLTTQNPAIVEIVTAVEKTAVRTVEYNKRQVSLRKPRVEVTDDNYKILQVLDLLTNFEKLSVEPITKATKNIKDYLSDVKITTNQLNNYLNNYPNKTFKKLLESELYNELTQRK